MRMSMVYAMSATKDYGDAHLCVGATEGHDCVQVMRSCCAQYGSVLMPMAYVVMRGHADFCGLCYSLILY